MQKARRKMNELVGFIRKTPFGNELRLCVMRKFELSRDIQALKKQDTKQRIQRVGGGQGA
jgi:hypothetical protein